MWLSFAIAPCLMAATVTEQAHDCCPHAAEQAPAECVQADGADEGCHACTAVAAVNEQASDSVSKQSPELPPAPQALLAWALDPRSSSRLPRPPGLEPLPGPRLTPVLRFRVLLI